MKKELLRPESFNSFIGQNKLIKTLQVLIKSSKKQSKMLDHILLSGPPGLGKTTLATIIGKEFKSNIKYVQGSLIEKKSDLLSIFCSIQKNEVIFIDEIHSINKNVEELLFPIMEDNVIDILYGVNGEQKVIRMELPQFTLIGATTKFNMISKLLRDRFGFIGHLENYNIKNINDILKISSSKINLKIDDKNINFIAQHSLNIPRNANNILKRVKDFVIYKNKEQATKSIITETFRNLGIFLYGLDYQQINYLNILKNHFESSFVSLDTLVNLIGTNKINITENIEPLLLTLGLIKKSSQGRKISTYGIEYLNKIYQY